MIILYKPVSWIKVDGDIDYGKLNVLCVEAWSKLELPRILLELCANDSSKTRYVVGIQATDVANDFPFPFTPPQFSLICAALEQFPVTRAVAASAAFPGPFTPITLRNYAGECGLGKPQWIEQALKGKASFSREYHTARKMAAYLDADNRRYIHLLDGGVIDNLGVRGPVEILNLAGDIEDVRDVMEITDATRLAIIVVNASAPRKRDWGLRSSIRGLGDIIGLTSAIMVEGSNFETMDLLRRNLEDWETESARSGSNLTPKKTYLVEVGFDALEDEEEKATYADIPTSLQLPEEAVDRLRHVASRILYDSKPFQDLVRELGGRVPVNQEAISPLTK